MLWAFSDISACELLHDFDGLRNLLRADQVSFCRYIGLGQAKYAQLQVVPEMALQYIPGKW